MVSRDCAISQQTLSQVIAHNFGADHSSGYLLNKGDTHLVGKGGNSKQKFVRMIMHYNTYGSTSHKKTNHYSNPNIIQKPANYMYFSKHIDKISALGNESCVCYRAFNPFMPVVPTGTTIFSIF